MKIMTKLILILLIGISTNSKSQTIPLTVTPVYKYEPLEIKAGNYDKKIFDLNNSNVESSISFFLKNKHKMKIEEIYILSVRLYDLGEKNKSIYWFHLAKTKARIFINMLNPEKIGGIGSTAFEKKQMFIAFNRLAGEYINGYGGGKLDIWVKAIDDIVGEISDYNNYKKLYPNVNFVEKSNLQKVFSDKKNELLKTKKYLIENKDKIYKVRKERNLDSKY